MKTKQIMQFLVRAIAFTSLFVLLACFEDSNDGVTRPPVSDNNIVSSSSMSDFEKCCYADGSCSDDFCCSVYQIRCENIMSSSGNVRYSSSALSSSEIIRYSSSSQSITFDYLTTSKTMLFTLKHFKQISLNWDASSNSLTDGDPRISFTIYFVQPNGSRTTANTQIMLAQDDIGEWKGENNFLATVPALTDTIKVCPSVIDEDVLANDDKSSGYCYLYAHIGLLDDYQAIKQDDYKSDNYILEWEWFLGE